MRLSLTTFAILASSAAAFTTVMTQPTASREVSALNLFGGGGKKGGESKGPGMMDQLAMFKKAQEMAQKKKDLDSELSAMSFEGTGADGKVKGIFKYVPNFNPMDPNPEYEPQSFEFDDEFFDSASPEELSEALRDAAKAGIDDINKAVMDKYAVLQSDLMAAMGNGPK